MDLVIDDRPENVTVVGWAEPTALDASLAGELRDGLRQVEAKTARLVLDMSQVIFVDSSIIGALVGLFRRTRSAGGDLKLAALTPDVETIFELTRLQNVFRILQSVDAAVAEFGPAQS